MRKNLVGSTVGFRVKSGWATAVLLSGPVDLPLVLDCRAIDLSDPSRPETRQPYHARFGTLEEDESRIERRIKVVRRIARASVSSLLKQYLAMGRRPSAAALVVGSVTDPAAIHHQHIRAHALEGRLFRTVLEEALSARGLNCRIVVERTAYAQAVEALGRSEEELKRALSGLRPSKDLPWRADEKISALAAWMALGR